MRARTINQITNDKMSKKVTKRDLVAAKVL